MVPDTAEYDDNDNGENDGSKKPRKSYGNGKKKPRASKKTNSGKSSNKAKKSRVKKCVLDTNEDEFPEIDFGLRHRCAIIKMTHGEEIICFINKKQSAKSPTIRIYYPANFHPHSRGLQIQQWLYATSRHWFDIPKSSIMTVVDCHDDQADMFCEMINAFIHRMEEKREQVIMMKSKSMNGFKPSNRQSYVSRRFFDAYSVLMSRIGVKTETPIMTHAIVDSSFDVDEDE